MSTWTFDTASGRLAHDGTYAATGYAGHGPGKDNPADADIPNVGPPPRGLYTIGTARTDPRLGPLAMPITPAPSTPMFGRSGFWIHGDNPVHPGDSSEGCIVLPQAARAAISSSGDTALLIT
jgi:hypothetical protein